MGMKRKSSIGSTATTALGVISGPVAHHLLHADGMAGPSPWVTGPCAARPAPTKGHEGSI